MLEVDEREEQVTLRDYLRILYRGRWIILLSFLTVVISVLYFTTRAIPIYQATATILTDSATNPTGLDIFPLAGMGSRETTINNQVEILKSRTLAQEVVVALRDAGYDRTFHLFMGNGGSTSTPVLPADEEIANSLQKAITVSPRRNTDLIDIKVQAPDPKEAAVIANTVVQVYRRSSQDRSRTSVREVKEFLETQLDVKERDLNKAEQALKTFKEQEGVITLSGETRELVEQLTDFEALYERAKTDLAAASTRLRVLRDQYKEQIGTLDENIVRVSSPLLGRLKGEMTNLEATHARLIAEGYADGHTKLQEISTRIDNVKENMRQEVGRLISTGLTVTDPMGYSQELLEQIYLLMVDVEVYTTQANAFKNIVAEYTERFQALPEKGLQMARLEREFQLNEKIYLMMKEKLEEAKIQEVSQIGSVDIIDPALAPKYPIKPRKKMNMILAALIGLGLGGGITFILDYSDASLKTIEDVENRVKLPVLAWIPTIRPDRRSRADDASPSESSEGSSTRKRKRRKKRKGRSSRSRETLISHLGPKSPISEAYRTLRTSIQFSSPDRPLHSILITSAGPQEGKSTTAANLAIVMAQMGSKTLLVDTDLRRPTQHTLFELEREPGLTEVLTGYRELEDVFRETSVPNLTLLTCGVLPPNPAELLGSERMRALIKELRDQFEMIVFDSPPNIVVTDASLLAAELDGVMLVIWAGRTNRDMALRGKTQLEKVGTPILGGILNNVNIEHRYGSYRYPYYYYYYYSSD